MSVGVPTTVLPGRFLVDAEQGEVRLEDGQRFALVASVSIERDYESNYAPNLEREVITAIRDRVTMVFEVVRR